MGYMGRRDDPTPREVRLYRLHDALRRHAKPADYGIAYGYRHRWYLPIDQTSQVAYGDAACVYLKMLCDKRLYKACKGYTGYADAIICVPPDVYESDPDVREAFDECARDVDVVYDERLPRPDVSKGSDGRLHYYGRMNKRLAGSIAKTMFSSSANNIWNDSFIVPQESRKTLPQKSCEALANLLMLDDEDAISIPTGTGTGSAFKGEQAAVISSAVFDTSELDEGTRELLDGVQRFRDYAALWDKAMGDYRFMLRLKEDDLLKDPEGIKKTLHSAAEVVNIDDYIKTWKMGIPIEDIVA